MIDFTQPILSLEGEPLIDKTTSWQKQLAQAIRSLQNGNAETALEVLRGVQTDEEPLTLAKICARALLNAESSRDLPAEQKVVRGQLALKVFDADGPIQLKAEQIVMIKEALAEIYPPLYLARAWPLLDPGVVE